VADNLGCYSSMLMNVEHKEISDAIIAKSAQGPLQNLVTESLDLRVMIGTN